MGQISWKMNLELRIRDNIVKGLGHPAVKSPYVSLLDAVVECGV